MSPLRQEVEELEGPIGELEKRLSLLEWWRALATIGTMGQEGLRTQLTRIEEQYGLLMQEMRKANETFKLRVVPLVLEASRVAEHGARW